MEQIDIIIVVICAALLILSFVMNGLANSRLSKLSEAISQVEQKIESVSLTSSSRNADLTLPESTHHLNASATDTSITDSRVGRYRPPNTTAIQTGSDIKTPPRPAVSKSGVKIEAAVVLEDDDVMDVVAAPEEVKETKKQEYTEAQGCEINPFIAKEQRIDFDAIKKALSSIAGNGTAVIDMIDIPMMIESEAVTFKAILKPYLSRENGIRLKNASDEIKSALVNDLPELQYS